MKNKINLLVTIIIIIMTSAVINTANGQFIFEHKYTIPQGGGSLFVTDLGNNNYKYVLIDYYQNQFTLFNLDHTLFMLVSLPLPSDSFGNYQVGYITTSLFDCDTSTVKYALMTQSPDNTGRFMVYRTDGTLLFSRDSVTMPYNYGLGNGSIEIHGIENTPTGAKLFLFNQNNEVFIYKLCGTVPESIMEIYQSNSYVKVFPNPSSNQINFQITPPGNLEKYELTIFNSVFQTIKTTEIKGENRINLNCEPLSSGTYYYSLQNKNKVYQTGKFIITK